jgi:hypothetical protein
MHIYGFIGLKGGCGKTTLAHLFTLGAVLSGNRAIMVHTDDRTPPGDQGRPYKILDGRQQCNRTMIKDRADDPAYSEAIVVLDGGGNRKEFNLWLSEHADYLYIPVGPSAEDARVAVDTSQALDRHTDYVLMRWPSNPFSRAYVKKYIALLDKEPVCIVPKRDVSAKLMEDEYQSDRKLEALAIEVFNNLKKSKE